MPARGTITSIAGTLVLALASPALAQDPFLDEELPDVVFTDTIRAQAAALGDDPVRIYEFVRNEFAYEAYYGLLKGPEQTLLSRADEATKG